MRFSVFPKYSEDNIPIFQRMIVTKLIKNLHRYLIKIGFTENFDLKYLSAKQNNNQDQAVSAIFVMAMKFSKNNTNYVISVDVHSILK